MKSLFIFLLLCLALFVSCGARYSQSESRQATTVAFDVDINGSYVVADGARNTLRLYGKDGTLIAETGGSGWGDGQFDKPLGVWARNGIDVFVADYGNHRIQRFDRRLAFISSYATRDRVNSDERFGFPTSVAVSRLSDLFICDGENSRILKLAGMSKFERTFGGYDAGKGRLTRPTHISIGPGDRLYVQDANRIVVFDTFGNYLWTVADNVQLSSADENGLVVISQGTLQFFDVNDRPARAVALEELALGGPLALTVNRGTAFLLTDSGVVPVLRRAEN